MNCDLEGGHGPGDGWRALHNRRSGGDGGSGDGDRRTWRINRSSREQGYGVTLAIHAVFLAVIGVLYMLIQIKYQNLDYSPFETHMAMTTSLVALCVYFCAAALQTILVLTNNKLVDPRLLNHVIVSSGTFSMLSAILVFFPDMVGWIVVVLFVFATTILLAYDVFKLITNYISGRNNSNINATPTPESVDLEMSTGINHNESSRNNNDAVECVLETISQAPHTPFHSFLNQGVGD